MPFIELRPQTAATGPCAASASALLRGGCDAWFTICKPLDFLKLKNPPQGMIWESAHGFYKWVAGCYTRDYPVVQAEAR